MDETEDEARRAAARAEADDGWDEAEREAEANLRGDPGIDHGPTDEELAAREAITREELGQLPGPMRRRNSGEDTREMETPAMRPVSEHEVEKIRAEEIREADRRAADERREADVRREAEAVQRQVQEDTRRGASSEAGERVRTSVKEEADGVEEKTEPTFSNSRAPEFNDAVAARMNAGADEGAVEKIDVAPRQSAASRQRTPGMRPSFG